MPLFAIGLSHKSAPLEIREKLSLNSSEVGHLLEQITQTQEPNGHIEECVIIATCNRLEVYAYGQKPDQGKKAIVRHIAQITQTSEDYFKPYLYYLQNQGVPRHIMSVAAGIDSLVLGEAQILGQLVRSYRLAKAHHTVKQHLSRLFEIAIHAGKRARTETTIGHNPASVSSVAVKLAQHHLGNLSQKTVAIFGAGKMGALTMQALLKHEVSRILIVSRSERRSARLAQQWGLAAEATAHPASIAIEASTLDQLLNILAQADVAITSTAAAHTIIDSKTVAAAMQTRPQRPLLFIDIALPRDVEAAAGNLPNVSLYNIDDLDAQVSRSLQQRELALPQVRRIILEETDAYLAWTQSRAAVPTINHFRNHFETIKQEEVERTLKRLQHLDSRDQALVAELAHRLVNKFLHQPTVRLKTEAANGNGQAYLHTFQKLFELEVDDSQ